MTEKNHNRKIPDDEHKREAQRILNRVERESDQVGASSMARTADKVRDHFLGEENPEADHIEVLGKRIARVLAAFAFVGLAIFLYLNYVAPQ